MITKHAQCIDKVKKNVNKKGCLQISNILSQVKNSLKNSRVGKYDNAMNWYLT